MNVNQRFREQSRLPAKTELEVIRFVSLRNTRGSTGQDPLSKLTTNASEIKVAITLRLGPLYGRPVHRLIWVQSSCLPDQPILQQVTIFPNAITSKADRGSPAISTTNTLICPPGANARQTVEK